MPIYMKYGDIKGTVTEEGHKEWIELNSFQWGVGRGISTPVGSSADRESSAPSVSEVTVTKLLDDASAGLLEQALHGEGEAVEIDFVKTDKGKLEVFLKYKLYDTMISGFSASSGGDRPTESLSLNFTKFEFENTGHTKATAVGSPIKVGYDIAAAKTV